MCLKQSIKTQHKNLCNFVEKQLQLWYTETTGNAIEEDIHFLEFKIDYNKKISDLFQWPNEWVGRKHCKITIFRDDVNEVQDTLYIRELFNLAHEYGHFVDYSKGHKFDSLNMYKNCIKDKFGYIWSETKANVYGISSIKGSINKILLLIFATLSLLEYIAAPKFIRKLVHKIWVEYYIYGMLRWYENSKLIERKD